MRKLYAGNYEVIMAFAYAISDSIIPYLHRKYITYTEVFIRPINILITICLLQVFFLLLFFVITTRITILTSHLILHRLFCILSLTCRLAKNIRRGFPCNIQDY